MDQNTSETIQRLKAMFSDSEMKDKAEPLFNILENDPGAKEYMVNSLKDIHKLLEFYQASGKYADDVYQSDIKMGKPKHVAEANRKERLENINNFFRPQSKSMS